MCMLDYKYERKILVYCKECDTQFDENDISHDDGDIDISENELGQDVLSFTCPYCKKNTTSLRRG